MISLGSTSKRRLRHTIETVPGQTAGPAPTPGPAPLVVVIIPAFNNAESIAAVVDRARAVGYPVIVVDDGSTDGTARRVRTTNGVRVLRLARNRGKGGALSAGFALARERKFDLAVTLDADNQHAPEDIPDLLTAATSHGYDPRTTITLGWRRGFSVHPWVPRRSRMGRAMANAAMRMLTGQTFRDTQCGFRVYPLAALEGLPTYRSGYDYETQILILALRAGLRIVEHPVQCIYPTPCDRVTHFRPLKDSARIATLFLSLDRPIRERRTRERIRSLGKAGQ